MSPRFTWNVERWSSYSVVKDLPELRSDYGAAVEQTVQLARERIESLLDSPRSDDIKHTLKGISERGKKAKLRKLGTDVDVLMLGASYHLYGTARYEQLPDGAVRACAENALQRHVSRSGRPNVAPHCVWLVDRLQELWKSEVRAACLSAHRAELASSKGVTRRAVGGALSREEERFLARELQRMLTRALAACGVASGKKTLERYLYGKVH